jgi:hypothetical protein
MGNEPFPTRFCLRCRYSLQGVSGTCPECGQTFDPGDPRTWTRSPRRFTRPSLRSIAVLLLVMYVVLLGLHYTVGQSARRLVEPLVIRQRLESAVIEAANAAVAQNRRADAATFQGALKSRVPGSWGWTIVVIDTDAGWHITATTDKPRHWYEDDLWKGIMFFDWRRFEWPKIGLDASDPHFSHLPGAASQ